MNAAAVRKAVAATGVALALASAAWLVPAQWPTYGVFFAFALAYSFVWLDSDAPASVAYMATATAFVYIAGFPILFLELAARTVAYPLMFFARRRGWFALPRPLRPAAGSRRAQLDLAAMLGLATIGSAVRVAVVQLARAAGVESLVWMVVVGEPTAYAVMGALSGWLPLPTGEYVVAGPHRLPVEDERVDVIFSAVLIVPFLVLLIVYGWLQHGLPGAAAWSLTSLAPHGLVQLLVRRRHLLRERHLALEEATASLAKKQRELEDLTYIVTHDVKAPMTAITMEAADLLDREVLPEPSRAKVKRMLRLARLTENMARDLLRMMRIVSEPEPVRTVGLDEVTAQALEMLRTQIAARQVRVDVASPLPSIPGQATKLRHVVENLIGNAIRFVPARTGEIAVSAARQNGDVVLSVRDNGVGIPAEYRRSIFEVFRRGPDGDADGAGSGMGLAIVKRVVEGHGGEVWVESEVGAWTVFRVRLPMG
jgi:signal transduction histidine kinase